MPLLETQQAKVWFEVEGESSKPWVTLLNGYSRSSQDFRSLSRHLVQEGFCCVRIDNRGAGQTEWQPGFKVSDMVADVVAVWNHLGVARSSVLGISYGGVLAQLLASQHVQHVESLVLVSTTPSSFFVQFRNDLSGLSRPEVEKRLSAYFSPVFAEKHPVLYRSMIQETSRVFLDPQRMSGPSAQRSALDRFDFTPLLHSVKARTLILHGELDHVIDPEAATILHRSIAGSELEIVPEAGHLFLVEAPKWLYARVARFLRENETA